MGGLSSFPVSSTPIGARGEGQSCDVQIVSTVIKGFYRENQSRPQLVRHIIS